MVEVTQADREAALRLGLACARVAPIHSDAILSGGNWDDWDFIQAFARHRIEATRELAAEVEKLRAAAIAPRDDMLMRASAHAWKNDGDIVVDAGNGVWQQFCAAIKERDGNG